jgi:FG-GAP repeat
LAHEAGSAYVFERYGGGQWNQEAKLIASNAAALHWFGWSVDISGDTAVIGSLQDSGHGDRSGNAYLFQKLGSGEWVETTMLVPSDGITGTGIGHSVAISADIVVLGAVTDDFGQFTGSAFAFRRDSLGNWHEVAQFLASDAAPGAHFGNALSIFGDNVLIGAWVDDHSGSIDAGSVYLFCVPVPEPASTISAFTIGNLIILSVRRRNRFHREHSRKTFRYLLARKTESLSFL